MSKPKPSVIRLSDDGHWCICHKSLHLLAKLPALPLRLKGPGIDAVRDFVQLSIGGGQFLADVLTGTIYDCTGEHNNNAQLRVLYVPEVWPSKVAEVSA
jgi:hypothetical protein